MGAKLNSKTHLHNTVCFSIFFSLFLRAWLQSVKKCYYDHKKMSLKNQEKGVKNTESVEKISQIATKQAYKQTNFKSMNKSEIVHISVAFLLINVLLWNFFNFFNLFEISINSEFFEF